MGSIEISPTAGFFLKWGRRKVSKGLEGVYYYGSIVSWMLLLIMVMRKVMSGKIAASGF